VIEVRAPDDMHVHLRQGPHLAEYARVTATVFPRALVMPNTLPPITSPGTLTEYRGRIESAAPDFTPLMSFKILPGMIGEEIKALAEAGAVAGKLYPAGATTNAEDGVADPQAIYHIFEAMRDAGLVLSVHAEDPEYPVLEREHAYLPVIRRIAGNFPGLRIVVEHLSTAEGVETVKELSAGVRVAAGGVAATITVHHLMFTLEDLIGESIRPHLYCKPVVKTRNDRDALIEAACSENPAFFFGSDSAPHPRQKKECAEGASGVFSSPVAMELLAGVFETAGRLDRLEEFTSRFGADFYGLPLNRGKLVLDRQSCIAPASVGGATPLAAGWELPWSIVSIQSPSISTS
jgi:dihydroorotase